MTSMSGAHVRKTWKQGAEMQLARALTTDTWTSWLAGDGVTKTWRIEFLDKQSKCLVQVLPWRYSLVTLLGGDHLPYTMGRRRHRTVC